MQVDDARVKCAREAGERRGLGLMRRMACAIGARGHEWVSDDGGVCRG